MDDMNEWLKTVLPHNDLNLSLAPVDLLLRLLAALGLGAVVAAIYRLTQRGDAAPAPSFVTTLILLCVLLAMVPQVIGNNAARAFSLVGILAIVRFRTTVEDTRDSAFVIVAVIVGMAVGVGNFQVAGVGLAVIGSAAILIRFVPVPFSRPKIDWTLQLRVGAGAGTQTPWEEVFTRHCAQAQLLSTATARQGAALDLSYKLQLKTSATPMQLLNEINRLEGIQNVEMKRNQ
jgi:hypothetical protein